MSFGLRRYSAEAREAENMSDMTPDGYFEAWIEEFMPEADDGIRNVMREAFKSGGMICVDEGESALTIVEG